MGNNILVTNLIHLFLFAFFMGVMAAIFGQKVYLTNNKYEADHTCYIVNNPYVADWVIYMTHNQYEAEEVDVQKVLCEPWRNIPSTHNK